MVSTISYCLRPKQNPMTSKIKLLDGKRTSCIHNVELKRIEDLLCVTIRLMRACLHFNEYNRVELDIYLLYSLKWNRVIFASRRFNQTSAPNGPPLSGQLFDRPRSVAGRDSEELSNGCQSAGGARLL